MNERRLALMGDNEHSQGWEGILARHARRELCQDVPSLFSHEFVWFAHAHTAFTSKDVWAALATLEHRVALLETAATTAPDDRGEGGQLLEQGLKLLRTIFPQDTKYSVSVLTDPESGTEFVDCEIQTSLPIDAAHSALDKFDQWWFEHSRAGLTFTLKF